MPPELPAYRPLPPLGSPQRAQLIDQLLIAFGGRWEANTQHSLAAQNPAQIYDVLSQISYHDRITLLYQVFRAQNRPDFVRPYTGEHEEYVRSHLLLSLSTHTDNTRIFSGAMQFFHLMSDAPAGPYHTRLLNGAIYSLRNVTFRDSTTQPTLPLFRAYDPGGSFQNDPNQLMRLMGVIRGNPPLRLNPLTPLGTVPAPQYEALPPPGSPERTALIQQLRTAMGATSPFTPGNPRGQVGTTPSDPNITRDFRGFSNPQTVFNTLGRFDYQSRLDLYREVLVANGEHQLALTSDYGLRQSLMFRFMYTGTNQKTFAGLQLFFRLVADAPMTRENYLHLRDEATLVAINNNPQSSAIPLGRVFDDREAPGVRVSYQRWFSIGGPNALHLPFDLYNQLALIGIPVGRPPLQNQPVVQPQPVSIPAPPLLWDRLEVTPNPLLGLPSPSVLVMESPNPYNPVTRLPLVTPMTPMAVV